MENASAIQEHLQAKWGRLNTRAGPTTRDSGGHFYRGRIGNEMRLCIDVSEAVISRGQSSDAKLITCPDIAFDLNFGMPSEVRTDRHAQVGDLNRATFMNKL